ncbi:NADH-ubiquinone oxidoreductase [Mycena kentingensis (nom. inval.)]|nr:NADH-ubiquinone oxidoreductase [Mycena kentingensis (nom. inval.)]
MSSPASKAAAAPAPAAAQPKVAEIGTTSGPLKSAAFFIGAHCKEVNEDFMLCKNENRDPAHCLKEGRRVTRCATDVINKLREHCFQQYEKHWQCLEWENHEYYRCRKHEKPLNACVFEKLGLAKTIPDTPEGRIPIHEDPNPILKRQQK